MLTEVPRQEQSTTKVPPRRPFEISWSLASQTLESILEEALRCEERGLDGVWFPDHEAPLSKLPELYVTLSAIAAQTRTVHLGSHITDVLRRHPHVTAHAFASLSHMAPGRVILGLGAGGGPSQIPFGVSLDHSVSRLGEGIRVIRMLWDAKEEKVDFSGKYFSLKRAQLPMFPHSEVPIYVASYGPRMLSLTAELADGWLPESHTPETYRKTLRSIHAKMRRRGRNPRDLHACSASIFYPWEPDEKSFSRILRAAKRYLADCPDIQWAAGFGEDHPRLRAHQVEQDSELLESLVSKVPDQLAEATLVCGSKTECYEKLSRMRDAGCAEAILEPYWIEKEKLLEGVDTAGQIKLLFSRENV
jgi:phthiodiolone/phenolphthiodiolone dimycocerosates ketoreductase